MKKLLTALLAISVAVCSAFAFTACDTEYSFDKEFTWVKYCQPENITKIKCESGYNGVEPDRAVDVVYTTDKTDIENVCEIFNHKLKPSNNPPVPGGYYISYTFYTSTAQYELRIDNGCIPTNNSLIIVNFTIPKITNSDSQCKKFNLNPCLVYSDEELKNSTGKYVRLSDLEFIESDESVDDNTPLAYVDTYFGTLKIIDDKTFIYEDITYKVVGEKNFSNIVY